MADFSSDVVADIPLISLLDPFWAKLLKNLQSCLINPKPILGGKK